MSQTIGRTIQRLREDLGFSQEELAARAELSRSTIQNIENGRRAPQSASLRRIARVLGTDAATLHRGTVSPAPATGHQRDELEDLRQTLTAALEQLDRLQQKAR